MSDKPRRPMLSLELLVEQQPPKRTSLLKFFCPFCGEEALTEKLQDSVYGVKCEVCVKSCVIQVRAA